MLPAGFAAFVRDLLARRTSREGRFLRLHYKTGAAIDLVPPGSLASGSSIVAGKWRTVEPDIDKMWSDYERWLNRKPKPR